MTTQLGAFSALFLLLASYMPLLNAESAIPRGDGSLRIYNYHLDEFVELRFQDNKGLNEDALKTISHIMRSRDNGEEKPIALGLILLIDHLQDHFNADTIEIISGYRSPNLNQTLRNEGHTVGAQSLHMAGQALDIHIDEIREETLRDYLHRLRQGGVGYYGALDFIHVDIGPVRQWEEPPSTKRKLIGVLPNPTTVRLVSDRNDYLPGSRLRFSWQGFSEADARNIPNQIRDFQLERFYRGRWEQVDQPFNEPNKSNFILSFDDKIFKSNGNETHYGRYRWTFRLLGETESHSSNEFYLKRL